MGLVDSPLPAYFKYYEHPFYTLRPSLWRRELLEDANLMVRNWIFSLWSGLNDQLSMVDEVRPFFLYFGRS